MKQFKENPDSWRRRRRSWLPVWMRRGNTQLRSRHIWRNLSLLYLLTLKMLSLSVVWILNSINWMRYKSVVCQKTYDERVLMAEKVVAKDEEVSSMRRLHQEAEERLQLLQERVDKLIRENLQLSDSHQPAWARTLHRTISNLEPRQPREDCGHLYDHPVLTLPCIVFMLMKAGKGHHVHHLTTSTPQYIRVPVPIKCEPHYS